MSTTKIIISMYKLLETTQENIYKWNAPFCLFFVCLFISRRLKKKTCDKFNVRCHELIWSLSPSKSSPLLVLLWYKRKKMCIISKFLLRWHFTVTWKHKYEWDVTFCDCPSVKNYIFKELSIKALLLKKREIFPAKKIWINLI